MGATIVVGAFWGDEGKGLISAYYSRLVGAKAVYRAGTGANAEHGIFLEDKKTYLKVNQLPLGWMFSEDIQIRIGSGTAVDPVKLIQEMDRYGLHGRVRIDYRCPIIEQRHIDSEANSKSMQSIGSTFSGTGYCRADFVLRKAQQARDIPILRPYLADLAVEINDLAQKEQVVVESSQGTFLSLALSHDYPNVTSDNVTAMAAADDVNLNWQNIKDVILVVKAVPSREGAGDMAEEELTPEEIKALNFFEPSSIGGVPRRKAKKMNLELLEYACKVNGATQIALTFLDHYDPEMTDVTDKDEITDKVFDLIDTVEGLTNVPVTILNTGKAYNKIIADKQLNWENVKLPLTK